MDTLRRHALLKVIQGMPSLVLDLITGGPDSKVILAGGAVRDLVRGEKPRDWDLFVENEAEAMALVKRAEAWGVDRGDPEVKWASTSDHAFTVWSDDIVQICHGWRWEEPMDLLEYFDFTVCQAAVWFTWHQIDEPVDTAGWRNVVGDHFKSDLKNQRLSLVGGIGTTTLERVVRLYSKGFIPEAATSMSGPHNEDAEYMHNAVRRLKEFWKAAERRVKQLEDQLESEEQLIRRVAAKAKEKWGYERTGPLGGDGAANSESE